MLNIARRTAIASATAAAAFSTSLLAGGGAAHAASPNGWFSYESGNGWCTAGMIFDREANGKNRAQGVVQVAGGTPTWNACVGELWRYANGQWAAVSNTHMVWGTDGYAIAAWTNWYSDGAQYLAKMCVHPLYGHTNKTGPTTCTSAH